MTSAGVRFYVLQTFRLHGCDASKIGDDRRGEAPHCDACGKPLGFLAWLPPHQVEFEVCPKGYCDLVYPPHDDFLVSARFKEIYEREGLRGLVGFEPVTIVKLKRRRRIKEDPPPYFWVKAVRSQTVVDQEASGFEWEKDSPVCPVCREAGFLKRWKRLVIDVDTWTGEDVFYALGKPGSIFVSERFKHVCETYALRNAAFIPAEQCFGEFCFWEIEDWEIRTFDETLAVLQSWNKKGHFDHIIAAMQEIRDRVVADATYDWIGGLEERLGEKLDQVVDAAAEAHYRLVGMPPAPWNSRS